MFEAARTVFNALPFNESLSSNLSSSGSKPGSIRILLMPGPPSALKCEIVQISCSITESISSLPLPTLSIRRAFFDRKKSVEGDGHGGTSTVCARGALPVSTGVEICRFMEPRESVFFLHLAASGGLAPQTLFEWGVVDVGERYGGETLRLGSPE